MFNRLVCNATVTAENDILVLIPHACLLKSLVSQGVSTSTSSLLMGTDSTDSVTWFEGIGSRKDSRT